MVLAATSRAAGLRAETGVCEPERPVAALYVPFAPAVLRLGVPGLCARGVCRALLAAGAPRAELGREGALGAEEAAAACCRGVAHWPAASDAAFCLLGAGTSLAELLLPPPAQLRGAGAKVEGTTAGARRPPPGSKPPLGSSGAAGLSQCGDGTSRGVSASRSSSSSSGGGAATARRGEFSLSCTKSEKHTACAFAAALVRQAEVAEEEETGREGKELRGGGVLARAGCDGCLLGALVRPGLAGRRLKKSSKDMTGVTSPEGVPEAVEAPATLLVLVTALLEALPWPEEPLHLEACRLAASWLSRS